MGELLFEGDDDLDEAIYISRDAGIELYSYEIDPEGRGKGLLSTQKHVNNGVLSRLFEDYSTKPLKETCVGRDLRLVFTGKHSHLSPLPTANLVWVAALPMRVGATIEPKYMDLLERTFPSIKVSPKFSTPLFDSGFRGPMRDQFEIALAHYKNDGTPYDFYATRCKNVECAKADEELEEGQKLKKCGKCEEVSYCGKECQTKDWPMHKRGCQTPAKRAEAEKKRNAGGYFISMNV